jgi:hypothetical protein
MFGEISARGRALRKPGVTGGEFVYGLPVDSCIVHHGKFARAMSAMGYQRKSAEIFGMSASAPQYQTSLEAAGTSAKCHQRTCRTRKSTRHPLSMPAASPEGW